MEQVQIEELVAELETRVDRLRSLYEQYFMGIEKMEPLVPKKDVERRFQTMRREQIRNTALRFRFQMVLQKYNTYQSYWMRIMRQIEDGTYKRDVLRARANLADRRSTRPPPPIKEKEDTALTSGVSTSDFPIDVAIDSDYPNEAPTRKVDIPLTRPKQKSASFTSEFSPFDEATTRLFVPRGALSEDEDPTGILPLVGGPPAAQAPNAGLAAKGARPGADPEKMRQLAARIKANAGKDELQKETPGALPIRPAAPPIKAAESPSPPAPPPAGTVAAASARKPPPLPPKVRPAAGAPAIAPPTPAIAMKPPGPPPAPRPAAPPAPGIPMRPPLPNAANPATAPHAPPVAAKPPPPSPQRPPPPVPKPATAATTPVATKSAEKNDLPENRVRQIYSQYVETKRKQNEPTTAITYEGVAKSLRESTARLKEKHGGNAVDFEVAVKDGKTILRPVVKKDAK